MIVVYYIVATLLPIDKIIGRIYPVFGCFFLFMALGILFVLFTRYWGAVPEFDGFRNMKTNAAASPIIPMLFTTMPAEPFSGFHATPSAAYGSQPANGKESRVIFLRCNDFESVLLSSGLLLQWLFGVVSTGLNGCDCRVGEGPCCDELPAPHSDPCWSALLLWVWLLVQSTWAIRLRSARLKLPTVCTWSRRVCQSL